MPKSWLFVIIAFAVLRLVFWLTAFPNPDEAYYWLWGQHLDWSYYDHPPLNAWVQGAFTAVFGRSNFTLRLPNLISSGAIGYTYYRIVHYLYRDKIEQHFWLVIILVLASPLYFLFLGLAWHDHLLITFSLISAYLFITFLDGYVTEQKGESWRLYSSAIAIALAGLCKYNAVFVPLGFLAAMIADRRLRPFLRDRRLYFAIAIASSALIPILVWNLSNDFQSFHYYVDRSIHPVNGGIKLGSCLAFIGVSFFVVSPFYWRGFYRSFKQPSHLIRTDSVYPIVAFWMFAVSTIILTVISLISAALYYWNITAYLLLFPLLPACFIRASNFGSKALSGFQLYGLLFATLLVVHYCALPLSALVSKDADPDSRMLFGWNEVAVVVTQQASELQTSPLLITTDYRSASALAYQLNDKTVRAISDRVDQFDFWYPDDLPFRDKNAVILSDDWFPVQSKLLAKFDRVSPPITVPIIRFGVWIKNYYVQRGYGLK
ncbi:4-amino-4-deoxy-L-arabinose transferase [Phormidesmis priestleyi ULC007]|uniref:4-amino-4-deoxy-L-arabinose transferase n=1 Tax=Phormidesmis priestleyi ULC007 TaxID=1920490 RepID=A0A2T1DMC7_9CYAN|nr:glycosyltransferase family 39 protein [Phormidesmis priestleyi]PSB21615.1 4-amino-4-deoxy-L-arabinose transferase [Phormidesmis priestleyi ULC007]PZO54656.1 MAG: 4-amino-4-deoxy-L-arabinose transferase [Phormidesmis priestleyi]